MPLVLPERVEVLARAGRDAGARFDFAARLGAVDQLPAFADFFALGQRAAEEVAQVLAAPDAFLEDGLEEVGVHGLRKMAVPGSTFSCCAAEPWFMPISSRPLPP